MAETVVSKGLLLARCALAEPLHSLNKFARGRGFWDYSARRYPVDTKMWTKLLRAANGLGLPIPQTDKKRRVVIKRLLIEKERPFDRSNMSGGSCKSIMDALRKLEWLADDNERHLIDEYAQLEPRQMNEWELEQYNKGALCIIEVYETEEDVP